MIKPLTTDESRWVEESLARMNLKARIAQLLMPSLKGDYAELSPVEAAMKNGIALGGVFASEATPERHRECLGHLQSLASVPLVVAADLERGPAPVLVGDVLFPQPLAVAAANDPSLARTMGQAAAVEGRSVGIHWTFAPVADINLNPLNPIANTRSLGDDPQRISRLLEATIAGLQEHGLAACAKHFPGDGVDRVDQHITTSINSLEMESWDQTFGQTFGTAIQAGVWSIMIGHIALPAWDATVNECGVPRPATLSPRIIQDLLRNKLGFEGLVVSDDMNMGGVGGYASRRDKAVGCIAAGCDILLFPRLPEDYDALIAAVESGEIPESRINEAAKRVLEFKARLGLHRQLQGPVSTPEQRASFRKACHEIAEKSLVKVRDTRSLLPLSPLPPTSRVLTITLSMENRQLPVIDEELRRRGLDVTHLQNPNACNPLEDYSEFEAVFVNFDFFANWAYGSAATEGFHNRIFLGSFHYCHPKVVFTSFGTPYVLRDQRNFPNLINAHSSSPDCQRAAVAAWFGEIPFAGSSPVSQLTIGPAGV